MRKGSPIQEVHSVLIVWLLTVITLGPPSDKFLCEVVIMYAFLQKL
jgi:hypothetical protein